MTSPDSLYFGCALIIAGGIALSVLAGIWWFGLLLYVIFELSLWAASRFA